MAADKITEVTIYESPDSGRTVYARRAGSHTRQLYSQDSELQKELKELEQEKRWVDIFGARQTNPELNRLCEQIEILYELSRRSK
jgi:hypothetical protein